MITVSTASLEDALSRIAELASEPADDASAMLDLFGHIEDAIAYARAEFRKAKSAAQDAEIAELRAFRDAAGGQK